MSLTFGQLEDLWVGAGGTPGWAPMAAGVAQAESGGTPGAVNASDPAGGSFGLWQVNGAHAPGGVATPSWEAQMATPLQNAREAVALATGGANWQPWTTDATWRAWQAAGAPPDPPAATVASWVAQEGHTASGAATGSQLGVTTGWTSILPWNWFGGVLSGPSAVAGGAKVAGGQVGSAMTSTVLPFAAKALLVVGGIAMVVLAGYKLASPHLKLPAAGLAALA